MRGTDRMKRNCLVAASAALSLALGFLTGAWWTTVIPGAGAGFLDPSPRFPTTVRAAFAGAGAWLIAAFVRDAQTGFRASAPVGGPFTAAGPSAMAYAMTAVLGAALSALGAWAGAETRGWFSSNRRNASLASKRRIAAGSK